MPTANAVLLIRPRHFGYNAEAAQSNTHQQKPSEQASEIRARATVECAEFASRLKAAGIEVLLFDDELEPPTPDAIFPNNWFSTHEDGTLVLYPMAVSNRRAERRPRLIEALSRRLRTKRVVDLTGWEARQKYLEGTGSVVLDRAHGIAYAARSVRTHDEVLAELCRELELRALVFDTHERNGSPEYHTNVVMAIGERTAVVCLAAIREPAQREAVRDSLVQTGHAIIEISLEQLDAFAGNLLQLHSADGKLHWVMSSRAHAALSDAQKRALSADAELLHSPLPTVESVGGGSARCMLAELYAAPGEEAY